MTMAIQAETKTRVLPSVVFYVLAGSLGLALFVAAFALDLFSADDVLFYRGLKIIALAALAQFILTLPLRRLFNRIRGAGISIHHQIATISLAIGLNMTFLIVVPVTLDRSVSVFLLGVMNERPTEIFSPERLETVFDTVYVRKYGAMDRRMKEQLRSGNVASEGDGYRITPAGQAFMRFSSGVATLFHLNRRYIAPEVDDAVAAN